MKIGLATVGLEPKRSQQVGTMSHKTSRKTAFLESITCRLTNTKHENQTLKSNIETLKTDPSGQ